MRKKILCGVLSLGLSVFILGGCAGSDKEEMLTEDVQETISALAESEMEDINEDNEIYYLSESYLVDRLDSFISFCRYYTEPSMEHEYWSGEFSQLVEMTMETKSNLGVINIYETNPNLIVTEYFAEKAEDSSYSGISVFFKAIQNSGNPVSCFGSNIHETWHYYAGTDTKAYIGYTVGFDNFVIEMAQSSSSPSDWIINDILFDSEAHDKLEDKLVNEDGVEWETQPSLSYSDLYQKYANENIKNEVGFFLVDSNNDGIPECIYKEKISNFVSYVVLIADEDGSIFRYDIKPELDEISKNYASIKLGFDEDSGHFYTAESVWEKCMLTDGESVDGLLVRPMEGVDIKVEYSREWFKEYTVSDDKTFELIDTHYFYTDNVSVPNDDSPQSRDRIDGTLNFYDGAVGGYIESGDTPPEWWLQVFSNYHVSTMSHLEWKYLIEKFDHGFNGSYEDYVVENTPSREELESKYHREIYNAAKHGDKFTLSLDEYIEKELQRDNIIFCILDTSEEIGYEEFLAAKSEWDQLPKVHELDFSSSWANFN